MITKTLRRPIPRPHGQERPLVIRTHAFLPSAQAYADRLLGVFLTGLGLLRSHEALSFCVRELAFNAKKANLKRVYFRSLGLDPARPQDYREGMETFKRETQDQQDEYRGRLKDEDLFITIELAAHGTGGSIAVRNNVEALPQEWARVQDKLAKAARCETLDEALGEVPDESEGAGLGIVIVHLMLRRLGLPRDAFQFSITGGETEARILLPLTLD